MVVISTSRTQQVLDESVDTLGVSTTTSLKSVENTRTGTVYSRSGIAAGVLVHCHQMNDGSILGIFGKNWTDVTIGSSPQAYTTYTESDEPVWVNFDPATGYVKHGLWSKSTTIPTSQDYSSRVLNGACSRNDYLYTLQSLDDKPYLQLFNLNQVANQLGEEFVPIIETDDEEIRFDRGCYISDSHLVVIGEGQESHLLYLSRKSWSVIGVGKHSWEYSTDTGWYANQEPTPERWAMGSMVTIGTCSAHLYKNTTYLSTVYEDEDGKYGKFWCQYPGQKWLSLGQVVLEDVDTGYAGYGVRLQGQLRPKTVNSSDRYAIPYIYSTLQTEEYDEETDQHLLGNFWSQLSIQR